MSDNPGFESITIELESINNNKIEEKTCHKLHNLKELNKFFGNFSSFQTCFDILVEDNLEPLSVENILKIFDKIGQRHFIINLRSQKDGSFVFYWRTKNTERILCLESKAIEELCDFTKKYLIEAVERGFNGIMSHYKFDPQELISLVDFPMLGDEKYYNLLMIATSLGNNKIVEVLLKNGFNVSHVVDDKIPADIAYEKKFFDVLLTLLKNNSRYPRDFNVNETSEDIRAFLKISTELRREILKRNHEKVNEVLNKNKNLRHFYNEKNESILTFSVVNHKFKIYEFLTQRHIFFGPREDIDSIMDQLNFYKQRQLRNIHIKSSKNLVEKHLMILMANSYISGDDTNHDERFELVAKVYRFINQVPQARTILRAVAAKKDFTIHFDFNREFVRYLNPNAEPYTNGLFLLCGRLFIGAKLLLDDETAHYVCGVLIHELCHFVMCIVYDNFGKPYTENDLRGYKRFEDICKSIESNPGDEEIINSVFDDYDEDLHHAELIVRSPQLLTMYQENEEKVQEIRDAYQPLHEFFESQIIPDIEKAIPKIEKEANEAYSVALRKISIMKKFIWLLILTLILGGPLLIWAFYNPTIAYKDLDISDQFKILNSTVEYRGLYIRLNELIANDSDTLNFLQSDSIKGALNGDSTHISNEFNSHLDQYIFLSPLNLTDEFWDQILKAEVFFQGIKMNLTSITSDKTTLHSLSSNQIKELLKGNSMVIGEPPESINFYIDRLFELKNDRDIDTVQDNVSNLTFKLDDVYKKVETSKLFLLSDAPGAGKSVAFQFMAKDIKTKYSDYWVEYLELRNLIPFFRELENLESNNQLINESLPQLISILCMHLDGVDRDLFIDRFKSGKVVLLWDAVDEISPIYDDDFLTFASRILKASNNTQFISTRLQNKDSLVKKFSSETFSLVPYTKQDRIEFIREFMTTAKNFNETLIESTKQKVEDFIENILKHDKTLFKEDINNPLMIRMITEIAIDQNLSKELNNIYKIYDVFVNMKLQIFDTKGSIIRTTSVEAIREISIDDVHMFYALNSTFPKSLENYLTKKYYNVHSLLILRSDKTWNDTQITNFGILSKTSHEQIDFVHRTFAEFFVAKYFIKYIFYEKDSSLEEMTLRNALLFNVAYNTLTKEVIIAFIRDFLKINNLKPKKFPPVVIKFFKENFGQYLDYFYIDESAPLYVRFFEKDERIMRILAKVDRYENIDKWLESELGISLEGKSSFVENNQLGLILMRSWLYERNGNKIFADFIKKSTRVDENLKANLYGNTVNVQNDEEAKKGAEFFSSVSEVFETIQNVSLRVSTLINFDEFNNSTAHFRMTSEFIKFSLKFLTPAELKQLFINSVHIVNEDLKSPQESDVFLTAVIQTLNSEEIKFALLKKNIKSETFFYKTLFLDNFDLNKGVMRLIEENLSDEEIFTLFTLKDSVYGAILPMVAAKSQDFYFFAEFLNFTRDHTNEDQFNEILLTRDYENDTMLQYGELYKYVDNFVELNNIYVENLPLEEIQKTYTQRDKTKLPSFSYNVKSTTPEILEEIADFLFNIFQDNPDKLIEYLRRRNEYGDTVFSVYKQQKKFRAKLIPFVKILTFYLEDKMINEILSKKDEVITHDYV